MVYTTLGKHKIRKTTNNIHTYKEEEIALFKIASVRVFVSYDIPHDSCFEFLRNLKLRTNFLYFVIHPVPKKYTKSQRE